MSFGLLTKKQLEDLDKKWILERQRSISIFCPDKKNSKMFKSKKLTFFCTRLQYSYSDNCPEMRHNFLCRENAEF